MLELAKNTEFSSVHNLLDNQVFLIGGKKVALSLLPKAAEHHHQCNQEGNDAFFKYG